MRPFAIVGALFGLVALLLGAFGAHGLEGRVTAERLAAWETGAHYLGWHATVLLALGLMSAAALSRPLALAGAWCLGAGALVFSGSLFVLVLTDTAGWGAITPIGGVLLAIGWGLLLAAALRGGPRAP